METKKKNPIVIALFKRIFLNAAHWALFCALTSPGINTPTEKIGAAFSTGQLCVISIVLMFLARRGRLFFLTQEQLEIMVYLFASFTIYSMFVTIMLCKNNAVVYPWQEAAASLLLYIGGGAFHLLLKSKT